MSDQRHCPRTPGFIDRIVEERVTDDDRDHAATCPSCGPVLARAERFDEDLRRTARRLVAEDLPIGVLDPSLSGVDRARTRRGLLPSLGTGVVAVAIAILAVAVLQKPPIPGGTESQPPLQIEAPTPTYSAPPSSEEPSTILALSSSITRRLVDLGFSCGLSGPLAPEAPRPSAVAREDGCRGPDPDPPNTATVVVGSAGNGDVVVVTITADLGGADTPDNRATLATSLSQLVELSFRSETAATDSGEFVLQRLPEIEAGAAPTTLDVGDVRVELERLRSGVYVVRLVLASIAT